MAIPALERRGTVEEYLKLERESQEKYEYRDGGIYGLFEPLDAEDDVVAHSLITANTLIALGKRLEGKPCRAYESNLRVRSARKTLWAHPDISVICGPVQLDPSDSAGHTVSNPKVIVEVLSPSTEAYDRGEKFAIYRDLPSFEEYVLISQRHPRVETFLRQSDGTWSMASFEALESTAKLRSLEVSIPLSEVFAGVDYSTQSNQNVQA